MSFVEVAKAIDIPNGQMKAILVEGKEILVINYDGKYFAIDGRCIHMVGELVKGRLEGKIITCPRHGAQFDVANGSCINGSKIGLARLKAKNLVTYEVKTESDSIKVEL
jgi:nitrite reductase/ring-hydroxylating ferredoxin subunit